ncbi:MAG: type III polyketide synthase [bacterium]
MVTIAEISTSFPNHYYRQDEIMASLAKGWNGRGVHLAVLNRLHDHMQVDGRYLALPLEAYWGLNGFGAHNDAWVRVAADVGESALRSLFSIAGIEASEISQLTFTTVTGISVPSLDARLINRLNLSPAVKRVPLFGLGCVAGVAGVARVADYLVGHPAEAAVLLSVELCSLTLQRDDTSMANLVSSGLFGDGAAAVLMVGSAHRFAARGPRILASRSAFFPDTERVMGWDVVDTGFKIVLSPEVPEVAKTRLRPCVEAFLAEHGLGLADIGVWIAHPGGPKVMDAIEEGLGLSPDALRTSHETLKKCGNLSSTSVLLVLAEVLAQPTPTKGTYGLMIALGPGFCAEAVLLQW